MQRITAPMPAARRGSGPGTPTLLCMPCFLGPCPGPLALRATPRTLNLELWGLPIGNLVHRGLHKTQAVARCTPKGEGAAFQNPRTFHPPSPLQTPPDALAGQAPGKALFLPLEPRPPAGPSGTRLSCHFPGRCRHSVSPRQRQRPQSWAAGLWGGPESWNSGCVPVMSWFPPLPILLCPRPFRKQPSKNRSFVVQGSYKNSPTGCGLGVSWWRHQLEARLAGLSCVPTPPFLPSEHWSATHCWDTWKRWLPSPGTGAPLAWASTRGRRSRPDPGRTGAGCLPATRTLHTAGHASHPLSASARFP